MAGHSFERIEDHDHVYVLVCECGWHSPPDSSAESVGTAWDEHRHVAGARAS